MVSITQLGKYVPHSLYDNGLTRSYVNRRILDRGDVRARAGEAFHEFEADEQLHFTPPPGAGPLPERLGRKVGYREISRPFVAELSDVQLVGPTAMPLTRDNRIVFENCLGSSRRVIVGLLRSLAAGQPPVRRASSAESNYSTVCSLVGPWCREYHHWLSDYLPRIRGLEEYRTHTGRDPTILVPGSMTSWMQESLELTGVDPGECVTWDGRRTSAERLVIPSLRRDTERTFFGDQYTGYVFSPRAYRWLGNRIRSNVAESFSFEHDFSPYVFISRRDANGRRVQNESELMQALSEYGFVDYALTDYSFSAQVSLFAQAECIVGPMGAGFTNMMFAEDPSVLMLFGSDHNACYYTMAQGLGLDFGYVRGTPVGDDMWIDPDQVIEVLHKLDSIP